MLQIIVLGVFRKLSTRRGVVHELGSRVFGLVSGAKVL
jgi:hypothetical protein